MADGTQTLLCTYLSAVLLVGLLLNGLLGWYWADPLAGLVIAGVAAREGLQAWRGDGCCAIDALDTAVAGEGPGRRRLRDGLGGVLRLCARALSAGRSGRGPLLALAGGEC